MCGIAGILALRENNVCKHDLEVMTRALAHRGPDGEGMHVDGPVGLGHRRLAILDLGATGSQPMFFADGRYWIVHNGEIYNFLELRETLAGLGYSFRSSSDTEVILAAFIKWGEDCQLRFNGMWAFAIWDAQQRRLFLSRDRFGVKPLFYFSSREYFAFASEMKAFLPLPWFPSTFRLPVVARAIEAPYSLEATEHCMLDGIMRLRAGYSLTIEPGGAPRVHRWWRTDEHLIPATGDFGCQVEEFRERFTDAVRLRMRSDVPLACTLSGGLDSGSVSVTAAKIYGDSPRPAQRIQYPPVAFTVSFPGTNHDERMHACSVARHAGMESIVVDSDSGDASEVADDFIFQCEEVQGPNLGPWLIYREMSRAGIKVCLDGHGGDELLAGYVDQVRFARDLLMFPVPRLRKAAQMTAMLRRMECDGEGPVSFRDWGSAGKIYGWLLRERILNSQESHQCRVPPAGATQWLRIEPFRSLEPLEEPLREKGLSPLAIRLYRDFHVDDLPTILREFDRYSMAHGVEVRSPFLDWRLVCYCLSLPSDAVLAGGQTKRILREAMRGHLPEPVRTRARKIPFKSFGEWWRGSLRTFVLDTVNSAGFLASEIWDGPAVRATAERSALSDQPDKASFILRFVVAHRLMELFRSARAASLRAH
ncbi:MAG: asparagine synthase (glutamine-hydrolyzing) [Deltaproteobacteria bacterium]|nr:asparagine synthase (glutamine-hydrolyzing) [Deltaproteobacteria bacterium]